MSGLPFDVLDLEVIENKIKFKTNFDFSKFQFENVPHTHIEAQIDV